MEATREDFIFNLNSSNRLLELMIRSDAPYDWRIQAYEQLQRNHRAMGTKPEVIAAIPYPQQTYRPPVFAPAPPPPAPYRTTEEVLMPVFP